jgi:ABC-2 type transport system permease protein
LKLLDAPKVLNDDFIDLDMTVSIEQGQILIGIGELQKQWNEDNRTFFQYKAEAIPFRFAVSSAKYAIKKEHYKGKSFEIYYHPKHFEKVEHLLKNSKITMDYCELNFGPCPFKTIRFAEISSFTKGFAATAYPTSIFVTIQLS